MAEGAMMIGDALKINTTLTELNLGRAFSHHKNTLQTEKNSYYVSTVNSIGLKGATKISESLMKNSSLTKLNLCREYENMNTLKMKPINPH